LEGAGKHPALSGSGINRTTGSYWGSFFQK
jgi:hypothetical protein